ncbi:MAG TPA: tyrosine--tRNA ligase, partial [Pyrinomonadaceae bacterium]|nr:tyrosine--tRNA ligase [Pyrinomonadaceae bacterium]
MGRNLQREYNQEPQVAVITPLLEGTDGVQKMSKSLGNYVGIDEPPQEIFGKVMSISDDLMWRYYELLTDLPAETVERMRLSVKAGGLNPRGAKVELAKRIITDFHSAEAASAAEEEFDRIFKRKGVPDDVEERGLPAQTFKLPRLLVEAGLAPSMAEARRLIEQGGVRLDGERAARHEAEVEVAKGRALLIQVGKRRFMRVRGE